MKKTFKIDDYLTEYKCGDTVLFRIAAAKGDK